MCNVSSVGPSSERMKYLMFLSYKGPTLETFDFTFYIGSTPTFLYFDLYPNTAFPQHKVRLFNFRLLFYTAVHFVHSIIQRLQLPTNGAFRFEKALQSGYIY